MTIIYKPLERFYNFERFLGFIIESKGLRISQQNERCDN
jgi:hypothetical protein